MTPSHLILCTASGLSHVFTIFQAAVNNYYKMLREEETSMHKNLHHLLTDTVLYVFLIALVENWCLCPPPPGGGLPYEIDGDARRLA